MTREETIKALKIHTDANSGCDHCSYNGLPDCTTAMCSDAWYYLTSGHGEPIDTTELLRTAEDMATQTLRDLTETLDCLHAAVAEAQNKRRTK